MKDDSRAAAVVCGQGRRRAPQGLCGVLVAVLSFPTTTGCVQRKQLDSFEAARVIQNSERFKGFKTIAFNPLAAGDCKTALVVSERWRQLQGLGLIETRELRHWGGPPAEAACEATLTEEVRKEAGVERQERPAEGISPLASGASQGEPGELLVPIATRHLVGVTAIRGGEGESAEVDFTWQWQPNKIGQKLGVVIQAQPARATLWAYEDGWRVVSLKMSE